MLHCLSNQAISTHMQPFVSWVCQKSRSLTNLLPNPSREKHLSRSTSGSIPNICWCLNLQWRWLAGIIGSELYPLPLSIRPPLLSAGDCTHQHWSVIRFRIKPWLGTAHVWLKKEELISLSKHTHTSSKIHAFHIMINRFNVVCGSSWVRKAVWCLKVKKVSWILCFIWWLKRRINIWRESHSQTDSDSDLTCQQTNKQTNKKLLAG